MSLSRVPSTLDALVALFTPGLAPTPVWDGPVPTGDFSDALYLGYDADPLGERQAASSTTKWAGIGAKKRDETITIIGAAVAISGDGIAKDARDRAYAIVAAAEQLLRIDPSMAQPPPFVASISETQLFWDWLENAGLQARLAFQIDVETRV